MKKKKEKTKKSKTKNSSNKNKDIDITKQVGTFNDFLIVNKKDETNKLNFNFLFNEPKEPFLKDWLIIQKKKQPTQSRFSNLFQEILENDKKMEKNKKNKKNKENKIDKINNDNDIDIDIDNEKLLPENLTEENENEDEKINFESDENLNIEEKMRNLSLNESKSDISFDSNYSQNSLKNINYINNNSINNTINNNNNINNISIPNNNFLNINKNNTNANMNIRFNFAPSININNNLNNINNCNTISNFPIYYYQEKKGIEYPSSGFPFTSSTAPSSVDNRSNSIASAHSNSSGSFYSSGDKNNNNNYDHYNNINNKPQQPPPRISEKKLFDIKIDIKKILSLEDRRTTLMIKNIPNKFQRDLILKTINKNFKGTYDLFILPTDVNGYKNFGYSFINFTTSYYIPYFYFLFHQRKWPNTNSQKICEITYSKIQGRNGLLSHYQSKITFINKEVKKLDNDNKYIIPNEYYDLFNSIYPNYIVEKNKTYFSTKMPFRY